MAKVEIIRIVQHFDEPIVVIVVFPSAVNKQIERFWSGHHIPPVLELRRLRRQCAMAGSKATAQPGGRIAAMPRHRLK